MARKDSRARKRQPQRRPRRSLAQRMGAWLPVAIVGVGAIVIGAVAIAVTSGGDSGNNTNVPIPTRTVAAQGRTLGPANARVTVEEYSDFQCPFCARAARIFDPQIEQDYIADGRARLVFQSIALLGDESLWAAEAAECANEQGKFWEYHDKLFESQRGENEGAFAIDNLKRFAQELGLDTQTFNQCLDSNKYRDLIQAETQDAFDKGIQSTPTFVIGDQTIAGPSSYDDLQKAIEAELRKNP